MVWLVWLVHGKSLNIYSKYNTLFSLYTHLWIGLIIYRCLTPMVRVSSMLGCYVVYTAYHTSAYTRACLGNNLWMKKEKNGVWLVHMKSLNKYILNFTKTTICIITAKNHTLQYHCLEYYCTLPLHITFYSTSKQYSTQSWQRSVYITTAQNNTSLLHRTQHFPLPLYKTSL